MSPGRTAWLALATSQSKPRTSPKNQFEISRHNRRQAAVTEFHLALQIPKK